VALVAVVLPFVLLYIGISVFRDTVYAGGHGRIPVAVGAWILGVIVGGVALGLARTRVDLDFKKGVARAAVVGIVLNALPLAGLLLLVMALSRIRK
jgi:hypothetical protein